MGAREQRQIHNEKVFRRANERLRGDWTRLGIAPQSDALFLCECGDAGCRDPIRIPIAVYERIRSDPDAFMIAPGHEDDEVEVVDDEAGEEGRFAVVRKRKATA